jgi:hypothetical protein
VVSKSYQFSRYVLGIRTNSEAAGEWLNETFGDHEVTDEEADPYFSIYVGDEEKGLGKKFHILYREATDILRSLDVGAIARRLVAELDALSLTQRDDGIFVDATVIGRKGVNALVPTQIVPYIRLNGRRVERELNLPDVPAVSVDPESGRLGPVPRGLDISDAALEAFRRRLGQGGAQGAPRALPETVDLVCAFHYDLESPPIMPLTRALAVYYLARNTINIEKLGGRVLEPLAKAVDGARCYLLQESRAAQAYQLLRTVLSGDEDAIRAAMVMPE